MPHPLDPKFVRDEMKKGKEIGAGTDGSVVLYSHPRLTIAVKTPRDGYQDTRMKLLKELQCMTILGKHPNIVEMLGYDKTWQPQEPALFYEYCALGDAHYYRHRLSSSIGYIPEMTIWKLFADVSSALNFLHSRCTTPCIHGDLKPDNILVAASPGSQVTPGHILLLPTFKLADFSRATHYKRGSSPTETYNGTWSYAPPIKEKQASITPASDVWSLGATIQMYAYGKSPEQSVVDFVADQKAKGVKSDDLPTCSALKGKEDRRKWSEQWPVVFRDLTQAKPPYSTELNKWYSMCLNKDMRNRISAADLAKWFVPVAERQICVLGAKWKERKARERLDSLQAQAIIAKTVHNLPTPPSEDSSSRQRYSWEGLGNVATNIEEAELAFPRDRIRQETKTGGSSETLS